MLKNKLGYRFLLASIFVLLLIPCALWAQNPVSVSSSSRKILIGDQITIWLKYQQKGTELPQIQWPSAPDSVPGLVWVDQGKIDTFKTKDSFVLKQKLTLTGFDSGNYFIPSFSFTIFSKNQASRIIHTDSLLVQVQTLDVDTTKAFKPIKGVKDMPITWLDYWKQILLGFLGLCFIVVMALYFVFWRKKKEPESAKVPPEKAHERALRLLAELKEKHLWQSGEIKAYYDNLSLIIRAYLENRFGISALESTSDELLKATHKMTELKAFRKQLRQIVQTADLAKFARANPMPEEHEACMNAAEDIVLKTKMTNGEGEKV